MNKVGGAVAVLAVAVLGLSACGSGDPATDQSTEAAELVVYSGRSEELVAPLIEQFEAASGVQAEVRYGDTAELAAQLLEEGDNSPADIFFAQDAGALQVIEDEGLATSLPADVVKKVPANFRSADDQWVGTSGRARVIVYNTDLVPAEEVPDTVFELVDPRWKGQVGIAPTNASFQAFVTAMRVSVGEERTKQWLEELIANDVQTFENNLAILDAVNAGTVELGLANHYYLFEKAAEVGAENLAVRNAAFQSGDPGNLVNVAGAAVLTSGADNAASEQFVDFLLSDEAQEYFAEETSEYPLVEGIAAREDLPPLSQIDGPDLTLDQLADLRGTQDLLIQVGLL
ncbi:MAG: iron ABC transporter substrate-binding protein [Micrococcales bacterium]|nr:iron ABC transporter substrate-binding protein [Micrococcales bacterium]